MLNYLKLAALGIIVLFAAMATNFARDLAYQVHAILIMLVASGMFVWVLRYTDEPPRKLTATAIWTVLSVQASLPRHFGGSQGFSLGSLSPSSLRFPS